MTLTVEPVVAAAPRPKSASRPPVNVPAANVVTMLRPSAAARLTPAPVSVAVDAGRSGLRIDCSDGRRPVAGECGRAVDAGDRDRDGR